MSTGWDGGCLLHRHIPLSLCLKSPELLRVCLEGGDTQGRSRSSSLRKDRLFLLLGVFSRATTGVSSPLGRRAASPTPRFFFLYPRGLGSFLQQGRGCSGPRSRPRSWGCPRGWGFRTPRSPPAGLGSRVREAAASDSRHWLLWWQRLL